MANELSISAVTGLSPIIQLYVGSTPVGSTFPATEIGSTGEYIADMPSVGYGRYLIVVTAGTAKIASGEIMWSGQYELLESMGNFRGINPNTPWTVTPTLETAGGESISISGDGETINVMQKA